MSMEEIVVKTRSVGKGAARSCRRKGLVPAILYGKGMDSVAVALDASAIKELLGKKKGHIHHIVVEDPRLEADVMVQDVEKDPLTGKIIHVDLHKISLTDKIRSDVPVIVLGDEELEKRGLILQRQLREIQVECLPKDLPENITVNVSGFNPGDVVTAGELKLPEGVRMITSPSEVVAVVLTPKSAEVEETPAKEAEEKESAPAQGEPSK